MNFLLSKSNILIMIMQIALSFSIFNNFSSTIPDVNSQVSNEEQKAFNQQFLIYQGAQSGSVVNQLISTISISNQSSEHKIQIYLNDSTDFTTDNIVVTQKYNVYWHYDNNGYIDAARINSN